MAVETLGKALSYGWRVTARCAWGKQREVPEAPKQTFRDWYLKKRKAK